MTVGPSSSIRGTIEIAQTYREGPSGYEPVPGEVQQAEVDEVPADDQGRKTRISMPGATLDTRRVGWIVYIEFGD
jgi:hypothetical protein